LIYGNLGNDLIQGKFGNDILYGGQGNDVMGADDAGNDIVYGNFGNDAVTGGVGNNTVYGGQGDDNLGEIGGPTNSDRLFGNLGADTFDFHFPPLPQSGLTQATADHISDFSDAQGDRINIVAPPTGIHYVEAQSATVTSVETAISFANSMNLQGNVAFIAGATDGYLLVDQNNGGVFGIGPTDFAVVLDGLNNTSLFGLADVISI
jgi:Ca2+-binding RTX toxin-like protein